MFKLTKEDKNRIRSDYFLKHYNLYPSELRRLLEGYTLTNEQREAINEELKRVLK